MRLDWLLSPITFYSLASVCLIASLTLFVSIKLELAKVRGIAESSDEDRESTQAETIRRLETEIATLRESINKLESAPPPSRLASSGLNLTKRAQALRMFHRGEPVPSIAAALETPSNEIALMLKVNGMTSDPQAATTT